MALMAAEPTMIKIPDAVPGVLTKSKRTAEGGCATLMNSERVGGKQLAFLPGIASMEIARLSKPFLELFFGFGSFIHFFNLTRRVVVFLNHAARVFRLFRAHQHHDSTHTRP